MSKEIGLMQIRTGKQRNLPPALEYGELAFTTDECRFFVGLPSTISPASLVAGRSKDSVPGSGEENVEVLTEFTPAHVLNRALYKAVKIDIAASSITTKIAVPSADRIFVDYVAFSLSGVPIILESGSIQVVAISGAPLLAQQNNTSKIDGIVQIDAILVERNANSALTYITIENKNTQPMRFEYIYRGWQEPV